MAIVEHQGRAADVPETVSDLLAGFAILARALAPQIHLDDVFALQGVIHSLLARAERLEREESIELLRAADATFNQRLTRGR